MKGIWLALVVWTTAFAAPLAAAPAKLLFAGGGWAALRFGDRCEAESKPVIPQRTGPDQPRAGFTFAGSRRGEFHVRLSRTPRPGSSVILTVGEQPFLLVNRGEWAWSRGPAQEAAIIAAVRNGGAMRIESRDGGGRRFVDRYLLAGAATAIDAAAAGCAGKI
jgi:hypothetical protein